MSLLRIGNRLLNLDQIVSINPAERKIGIAPYECHEIHFKTTSSAADFILTYKDVRDRDQMFNMIISFFMPDIVGELIRLPGIHAEVANDWSL